MLWVAKILQYSDLIQNMGWRYIGFRSIFEVRKRLGLLQKKFPVKPPSKQLPTKQEWLRERGQFFFMEKSQLSFPKDPSEKLDEKYKRLEQGHLLFFSSFYQELSKTDPWKIHPQTGYQYPTEHWTKIADFSSEAGDIKYVWEKARFSYLLTLVRHDYHFEVDHSELVIKEIIDFIDHNPINQGPHYRCSQEISIRLLNWMFALYYYAETVALSAKRWEKIITAIYWQVHHVHQNIHFSRIAVRNNHALSETLCLYLMGLLFPNIPDFVKWKDKGKSWFEQEVAYQVYPDGTFLQFSMNYHRVVVQLLTYAVHLAAKNGEEWASHVYDRAQRSVFFLRACMAPGTGKLPNYGMNDGALFFPLNDEAYRDFRPQLQALEWALTQESSDERSFEDYLWLGAVSANQQAKSSLKGGWQRFDKGGYYILKDEKSMTFLRCGSHKDRPHQADNLHLDIWYEGQNIFRDAGSFQYNTEDKWIRYFNGTESHNSLMIDQQDQMLKGDRFIWFFWSQAGEVETSEEENYYQFEGSIKAFRQISNNLVHIRQVKKHKTNAHWIIKDLVQGSNFRNIRQIWHPHPAWVDRLSISCKDEQGDEILRQEEEGWYAPLYGQKSAVPQWSFYTSEPCLITEITLS